MSEEIICTKCIMEKEFTHIQDALLDNRTDYKELSKNVAEMMLSHQKTEWFTEQIKVTQDKMVLDNEVAKKAQIIRDNSILDEKKKSDKSFKIAIILMAANLGMGLLVKYLPLFLKYLFK